MSNINVISGQNNLRNSLVDMLTSKNLDMKGRRVVSAGDAVNAQDYVTLNDLQNMLPKPATSSTPATGPSIQTNVSSLRAFGTVYHNTLGVPVYCSVSCLANTTTAASMVVAYTDSSTTPALEVGNFGSLATLGHDIYGTLFFIVLPSNYYRVIQNAGTPSIMSWVEWH